MRFARVAPFVVLSALAAAPMVLSAAPSAAAPLIAPLPSGDYYLTMTVTQSGEKPVTPSHSVVLSLTGTASASNDLTLRERGVTNGPTFVGHSNPDGSFALDAMMGTNAVALRGARSPEAVTAVRGKMNVKGKQGVELGTFFLAFSPPTPHANLAPNSGNQTSKKGSGGGGRTINTYQGPCAGCSSTGSPPDSDGNGGAPAGGNTSSTGGGWLNTIGNFFGSLFNWGGETPAPAASHHPVGH